MFSSSVVRKQSAVCVRHSMSDSDHVICVRRVCVTISHLDDRVLYAVCMWTRRCMLHDYTL